MEVINVLHVQDSEDDSIPVARAIETAGYNVHCTRIEHAFAMASALWAPRWDVILIDRNMPQFAGFEALNLLHQSGHDIPVIIVFRTDDEATAVQLMRAGAADYIVRDDLTRLVPAIVREAQNAEHRRARRVAEARLVERERMLSNAQSIAKLGSWERNFLTRTLWWSEEMYSIIGRPLEYQPSFEGSYAGVALPEDREAVENALRSALQDGRSAALEHRVVRTDGSVIWVYTRLEPELGSNGEPHRLFGTVLDISERKKSEMSMRFQARLLNTVEQAVVATDLEGRVVFWNAFAEKLYGWTADEAIGRLILELTPTEISAAEAQAIWSKLQIGETWSGEFLVRGRNGDAFWTHVSDSPVFDDVGNQIGVIGVSFDVTGQRQDRDALRGSEANYRTLFDQAADGIVVTDPNRIITTANQQACKMLGYNADELVGLDIFGFFHPDEIRHNLSRIWDVQGEDSVINERLLRQKDGSYLPTEKSAKRLADGRLQVIFRDISERKRAEEALRRSEREYRSLFEGANDAIIIFDPDTEEIVDLNRRATEVYGVVDSYRAADSLRNMLGERPLDQLKRGSHTNPDGVQDVEVSVSHPDGTGVELLINASRVEFHERQVVLSIHRDVTQRKELEHQLAHQALHDRLTGLANRALFADRMMHALARAREDRTDIAILMLDLDRFKLVNENFGHEVGDQLLSAAGRRLGEVVREGDTIARLGSDEFTILLENVANTREVTLVAERVASLLQEPYVVDGHEVIVTASIGIVLSKAGRGTPEDLLRSADMAMYQAKDVNRGHYIVLDYSMKSTELDRFDLEMDLRRAIAREELQVFFQPMVELSTGYVVGMEALVRWKHPRRGWMSPGDFIPLAEEIGLIRNIDQYVLGRACRQLALWQKLNPARRRFVLNVNISAEAFRHPELVQDVSRCITDSGVEPSDIQLEITETVIMTDAVTTHSRLRQLKDLGVRLAIDDFGTGYSSLSYLNRFPIDTLKIDKSFVYGLGSDPEDTAIVSAVISLGRALGLDVVAEGVESAQVVEQLQALGCPIGQGYHFSRPLPAEAFDNLWSDALPNSSSLAVS